MNISPTHDLVCREVVELVSDCPEVVWPVMITWLAASSWLQTVTRFHGA